VIGKNRTALNYPPNENSELFRFVQRFCSMMPDNQQPGCLLSIFSLFGISPMPTRHLPYRRKDYLLTRAERAFFSALCQAVGEDYLLFAKVRLADLVFLPKGTESRQTHFNRVQSKHVDFLLCDRSVIRPLLAIELDDSSHAAFARRERDDFVDAALAAAGLAILRVRVRASYSAPDLRRQIQAKLSESEH